MTPQPTVGGIVHYRSYGTPGREYLSVCRAAIVTAVHATHPTDRALGTVDLCVLNPEGIFFNRGVRQSDGDHQGGTWHWPERA